MEVRHLGILQLEIDRALVGHSADDYAFAGGGTVKLFFRGVRNITN